MGWLYKAREVLKKPVPPLEQTLETWLTTGFSFEPKQQEFIIPNAFNCARAAALSYLKEAGQIETYAKKWGFTTRFLDKDHRYFGIVLLREDMILVAYKGTNSCANLHTNIDLLPVNSSFGSVHRGFFKATDSLLSQLATILAEFQDEERPLWFTGHSLGGAIALLSAVEVFSLDSFRIGGVYTFGQPAVGSLEFRRTFEKRFTRPYFRLVNGIDLVPRLFTGLFRGHVGKEFYFSGSGEQCSGDVPWRVKAKDSFLQGRSRLFGQYRPPLPQVASHGMRKYLRVVAEMESTSASQGHA